jgi:hypothetical protein
VDAGYTITWPTPKRSNATTFGLKINYAVRSIINPAIKKKYADETDAVNRAVGIDVSKLFVATTGIRWSNDLVWVGRAANYLHEKTRCGL